MRVPPSPLLNFFVCLVMVSSGLRARRGEPLGVLRNHALSTRTLSAVQRECDTLTPRKFLTW
jgi:hypothetical protein